jgi:hypothetical protein
MYFRFFFFTAHHLWILRLTISTAKHVPLAIINHAWVDNCGNTNPVTGMPRSTMVNVTVVVPSEAVGVTVYVPPVEKV